MRKLLVVTTVVAWFALSATAHAASSPPGTHVKGVTAECTSNNTHVDIHLSDVPAGTEYLAVFTGALQGSPHGTTDGGDITVDFPGSCKCDATFTLDVSLDRGPNNLSEDTPLFNVPIKCVTPPSSTPPTGQPPTSVTTTPNKNTTTTGPMGTSPSTTTPGSTLPFTGSSSGPFTAAGIFLVALGLAGMAVVGRRHMR